MHKLDHLLWEELRLEEGEGRFSQLTGATPAFGGKHPDMGTHNSLLSLGAETYLALKIGVPVFESELPLLLAELEAPRGVVTLDSSEGFRVE